MASYSLEDISSWEYKFFEDRAVDKTVDVVKEEVSWLFVVVAAVFFFFFIDSKTALLLASSSNSNASFVKTLMAAYLCYFLLSLV